MCLIVDHRATAEFVESGDSGGAVTMYKVVKVDKQQKKWEAPLQCTPYEPGKNEIRWADPLHACFLPPGAIRISSGAFHAFLHEDHALLFTGGAKQRDLKVVEITVRRYDVIALGSMLDGDRLAFGLPKGPICAAIHAFSFKEGDYGTS